MAACVMAIRGLSPRGRGKPRRRYHHHHHQGSIPAWAGETVRYLLPVDANPVYPRVGGGNPHTNRKSLGILGLSPRGRGKPNANRRIHCGLRSIPAWAGETLSSRTCRPAAGVYPRVGGGNPIKNPFAGPNAGLSPRGRGKLLGTVIRIPRRRSIPAWAGETPPIAPERAQCEVYPRVGGGNSPFPSRSPRYKGLSPRGRGKPRTRQRKNWLPRSIPAWAGETVGVRGRPGALPVYPRVGGGNSSAMLTGNGSGGLSPRGRGKRSSTAWVRDRRRSIPAWAGETTRLNMSITRSTVYPRVGGGNPEGRQIPRWRWGLSPRGRGKQALGGPAASYAGSIPAWAGETPVGIAVNDPVEVYPRVGGGNPPSLSMPLPGKGLSPRGRGKQDQAIIQAQEDGSIPAWAGETASRKRRRTPWRVYPRVGGGNVYCPLIVLILNGLSPRGRGKRPSSG